MPHQRLARFLLLPNLELKKWRSHNRYTNWIECQTNKKEEFCPKCGVLSRIRYDRRSIQIKDAPLRASSVYLVITKKRFWCAECKKPFTETIPGILPRKRTTERFRRELLHACERYSNLKAIRRDFRCSDGFIYKTLYEQLELKRRKNLYPWPQVIGIDEHSFQKRRTGNIPFATLIVDYKNKKPFEVVDSRSSDRLLEKLKYIPGRENVEWAALDLCDPFKKFVRTHLPNAQMVADKFHVLRLLHPSITKERKRITGDKRTLRIRKLLLMSAHKLDCFDKADIISFLNEHPKLKDLWIAKEKMHAFYRIRGLERARFALHKLVEDFKKSQHKELKTLGRTLFKWAQEILNYFKSRLTNARTEGFNNKAKLVKKQAYGYRSFKNYRLRLLCAGL